MNSFEIAPTPLPGVLKLHRKKVGDSRGFLSRIFCRESLVGVGWSKPIAQVNHTFTQEVGVVRGLHFQYPPFAEMKLITCVRGMIWDVAVDLRKDSTTFLHWHAELLSADNHTALLLPEGVAHGFQALEQNSELIYCHSAPYNIGAEGGLHPLDPKIAICWPLDVHGLSKRDSSHLFIDNDFVGVAST